MRTIVFSSFFIAVLAVPFIYVPFKAGVGLLLLVIQYASPSMKQDNSRFDFRLLILCLLGLMYVIIPELLGLRFYSSFLNVFSLHVVFVAFWWFVLRKITNDEVSYIAVLACFVTWVVWLYALGLLAQGLGYIPEVIPDLYDNINVDINSIGLSSNTVSALLFLSPVLTYSYLRKRSLWHYASLVLFWAGIVALGRRSAFVGLAVPITLLMWEGVLDSRHSGRTFRLVAVFVMVLCIAIALDIFGIRGLILERWTRVDEGASERLNQARALWYGFTESPYFGKGLGAIAHAIRSEDKPWRYELSYVAALFRYGLFGCGLLLVIYGGAIASCLIRIRNLSIPERALLAGAISQVIAYAVNPVFDTFDTAWQLLLPVLFAARSLRRPHYLESYHYVPVKHQSYGSYAVLAKRRQ
ncbi:MAG: hypothetical protein EOR00_30935 [Mesorhizobium sp.]|uniref:O-antigen ligase family protein n=1 Tax=Mesorhizobium sp. TaxID=1871066 RepID=UPI000FE56161|nr:hypothetical protein [Mesorhizobium sp.]RWP10329.1 MAG: hypothetical protein EOR00_30935 [Mesorhizobium sp.]